MRTILAAIACAGALALSTGTASAASKVAECDAYARQVANSQANVGGQTAGGAIFGTFLGLGIGAATGQNLGTSAAVGAGAGGLTGFAVGSAQWQKVHDAAFADCMQGGNPTSLSSQAGLYEPWSPEWFAYCDARYQTFDETDGTFMSNAGYRKLCR